MNRMLEKLTTFVVWRLPRSLVYWCAIRVAAHATTRQFGNQVVPDLLMMDALARWDIPHEPGTTADSPVAVTTKDDNVHGRACV